MPSKCKRTRKAMSVPAGLGVALLVSLTVTLSFSAWIAGMLDRETITWEGAGYWIMGMLLFSAFVGGKAAAAAIQSRRLAVSAMSGLLYWGMLLCITALFFGGNYSSVWETALLVLAGSLISGMIPGPRGKKKYKAYSR